MTYVFFYFFLSFRIHWHLFESNLRAARQPVSGISTNPATIRSPSFTIAHLFSLELRKLGLKILQALLGLHRTQVLVSTCFKHLLTVGWSWDDREKTHVGTRWKPAIGSIGSVLDRFWLLQSMDPTNNFHTASNSTQPMTILPKTTDVSLCLFEGLRQPIFTLYFGHRPTRHSSDPSNGPSLFPIPQSCRSHLTLSCFLPADAMSSNQELGIIP